MDNTEGRKVLKWAWIALAALTIFIGIEAIAGLKGLGAADPASSTISVTGEGEMVAIPDLATFTFSVTRDASTVEVAQAGVTEDMNAVLLALENLGIEERDIKTVGYAVYPRHRFVSAGASLPCTPEYCPPSPGGRQVLDGYTASHTVSIKVRDTSKAGAALAAVGELGATNVSGISFTVDDPEELMAEARAEAIKDAREKAKKLASDLGVRLVKVVSYSDSSGPGYPVPYGLGNMESDMRVTAVAPQIPQGENEIRVVVNVTYEIR